MTARRPSRCGKNKPQRPWRSCSGTCILRIGIGSTETPLFDAITDVSAEVFSAQVIPTVSGGFTDSHFFRDLGIPSYGFDPIVVPEAEFSRIHGNDERINVAAFKRGVIDHLAIIAAVVYD